MISEKRGQRMIDQQRQQPELGPTERTNSKFLISSATPSASSMDFGHPSAGNTPLPTGDRATSRVSSVFSTSSNDIEHKQQNKSLDPSASKSVSMSPIVRSIEKKPLNSNLLLNEKVEKLEQLNIGINDEVKKDFELKPQGFSNLGSASASTSTSTNKAMAIVQPTENVEYNLDRGRKSKTDDDLEAAKNPSISANTSSRPQSARPISELNQNQNNNNKFDIQKEKSQLSVNKLDDDLGKQNNIQVNINNNKEKQSNLQTASSLDSIELPENLMQSLKRIDVRNKITDLTPSPNLLLGQVSKQTNEIINKISSKKDDIDESSSKDSKLEVKENKSSEDDKQIIVEPSISTSTSTVELKDNSNMKSKKLTAERSENISAKKSSSNNNTIKSDQKSAKVEASLPSPDPSMNQNDRPTNPMGRDDLNQAIESKQQNQEHQTKYGSQSGVNLGEAKVKNHQVVVNKLDKRKTQLEIVDIRDESVTGKMGSKREKLDGTKSPLSEDTKGWISMDGIAVTQQTTSQNTVTNGPQVGQVHQQQQQQHQSIPFNGVPINPKDFIENRFNVDYKSNSQTNSASSSSKPSDNNKGTLSKSDSLEEQSILNNIENELELDNKYRNRKYFVYIVHDGHLTAKKECIARIELPAKRRITLADLRQLIANSPDISLSSLKRNRFKFVTETYRLLNEDEDAAVLHQVYPTQGVFLKINIAEQSDNLVYPAFRGARSRLSSSSNSMSGQPSSSSRSPGASRRFGTGPMRASQSNESSTHLPAIHVNEYSSAQSNQSRSTKSRATMKSNSQARFSGKDNARNLQTTNRSVPQNARLIRSKSGLESRRLPGQNSNLMSNEYQQTDENLGRSINDINGPNKSNRMAQSRKESSKITNDIGANVISGAKKLFNAIPFHR